MSYANFFSFVSTLKPTEIKALGELSHVAHFGEGEFVYKSGDPSDGLYIINRGAVEIVHEDIRYDRKTAISYLGRGDIFGENDILSNCPRKNAIRTCEPVSLQCFHKSNFSQLIQRVPSFFYFLCEQLASQLNKVSDIAFLRSASLELSGNLANFDMVTTYQTIMNSTQTGELAILDQMGDATATFRFKAGQPVHAAFYHLRGEEAFWQLFLHEKLEGTFTFCSGESKSVSEDAFTETLQRNPTDLLITALQYRDEFTIMLPDLPDPSLGLKRAKLNLDWDIPDLQYLRPLAEAIWQFCYTTVYKVEQVFESLGYCELKFYKVLQQLLLTGHFDLVIIEKKNETPDASSDNFEVIARTTQNIPPMTRNLRSSAAVLKGN